MAVPSLVRHVLPIVALVALAGTTGAQHEHQTPAPSGGAMPDHMAHRFEDAEGYAKRFDDPARDAWQMPDRVIETLAIAPGSTVADIGAGTGYFSVRFAKAAAGPTVYAADIEPSMVDYLKARAAREQVPNLVAVLAGPESPNLPKAVDLVLIVDTYHHIADRVAYFRRLRTSMTPGARLAIIDFRKDSPEGPPVEFRFTPEQISGELAQAGFALQARHDFLPRQHFLVYGLAK
jgi:SAM-dependent methyltransferase